MFYQLIKHSSLVCGVLSADKILLISMPCFSRMLISNVHKSIIVMNSIDTRLSRNVFGDVQKTRSRTCFIRSKTTQLCLVVLNPIKHSCSFFEHYLKFTIFLYHHTALSTLLILVSVCSLTHVTWAQTQGGETPNPYLLIYHFWQER